ncbi:GH32 C-terminal domain-containing protein [Paenarthrobacter aurescens]|uniref:beta-fructofuranosidase n=1 Tax=Paenarthrobacter aurescens TaxID=43663 RepID=A0A4Y3NJT8_PAEAU|nr:family 43 glycosylhydrolase [Paenarthrobacter aurescens]MDO6142517.1 family 43 glycosylhydrolase [Paenarthrobacter aurescens]MDO6157609.1 family 43 glycosylhydrolase [Paenarthrobacter aurescens]MDO6161594.1 family 43 glycosylhydrolase [Paenarthrobacter aurescens]GEB20725.1 beta-fructofuranosidase [Paenarthrobacter aurescens]
MKRPVFFQPADGWVGDLIPFEKDGEFWLFYLHEDRSDPKPGTSWNLVTTKDLTQFEDHGVSLHHGSETELDFNAYTGSIVKDDSGVHHLFYTGQNPRNLGPDGVPLQLVMHATSTDGMRTWHKHPEHTFGAPAGYESGDWRDPFVFRDDSKNQWRMLLAARHSTGPERRRGVIAQCVSADLTTWQHTEPFWDPRRYITHECPDVFQWGGWWYMVYSEFSESFTTRYRMAKSPEGPWSVPALDSIDGRAFYASKTAERDGRRFFFGWIASKEGNTDHGPWQWAGTMSVLEARQNPDGTLGFSFAEELVESFWEDVPVSLNGALPSRLEVPDGYTALVSDEELPQQFYAKAVLDIAPNTTECGLLLRSNHDGDHSYVLRLEPKRGRLVFDRWPRAITGDAQWHVSGDVPFDVELERPCNLTPGEHTLEVIVDGDTCVAVVDHQVALSARIYDFTAGRIGVFAGEGTATLTELEIRQRTDN